MIFGLSRVFCISQLPQGLFIYLGGLAARDQVLAIEDDGGH